MYAKIMSEMQTLTYIVGNCSDPQIASRIDELTNHGRVEYLLLSREDTLRRRLRVSTDKGTDCAVALSRSSKLVNGSVLYLTENKAIIVQMVEEEWLNIKPADIANALKIGYFVGNLHWQVKFDNHTIKISQESERSIYLNRLKPFIDSKAVEILDDD